MNRFWNMDLRGVEEKPRKRVYHNRWNEMERVEGSCK